jgi:hypothetical protein
MPSLTLGGIILPTTLPIPETFVVIGFLQNRLVVFCVDDGFSAKTPFTVSFFAAFLGGTVIWHRIYTGHDWIAYRHRVRWHWILAVI